MPKRDLPPAQQSSRPPRFPPLADETVETLRRSAEEYVRDTFGDEPKDAQERYAEGMVRAMRWLQLTWGPQRACPYCANNGWSVGVAVQLLNGLLTPTPLIEDKLQPMFTVTCTNCGQTVLVSEPFTRQADEQ